MKKLFFPIVALIVIVVIAGCSTKFNVGAPYKNITVVYGFLDQSDTAHYIRVQKAFLTQNQSAITVSQTADSSFYSNIDVMVKLIDNGTGNPTGDTIHLNRVDLDLEGYPKQPGTFFTAPNYAYKFKNQLNAEYNYRLMITNLTTGEVDSANAVDIDDQTTGVFVVNNLDDVTVNLAGMEFATTVGPAAQNFTIQGSYTPANSNETNPVAIVQAVITFNWIDSNISTHTLTPNSYAYNLGYETLATFASSGYAPSNLSLYDAIYAGLGPAPANTYRLMNRCSLSIYGSTNDFSLYEQAAYTQGTGLTGDDIEPVFTNIQGANVLGLYTSRGLRTGLITITPDTIDSLIASPYLAAVKIAGTIYH